MLIGLTSAAPAPAQLNTNLYAGPMWSFYSGDVGYGIGASVMAPSEDSGWSYGGEFEYRKVSLLLGDALDLGRLVPDGLSQTDVQTLFVRAHGRYDFLRDSFIRPYVNLGLGVSFNWLDDGIVINTLNNNNESVEHTVTKTAPVGFDILGAIGAQIDIPIVEGLHASAEIRTSMNVVPVSTLRTRDNKHVSEWTFLGGAGIMLGVGYQW